MNRKILSLRKLHEVGPIEARVACLQEYKMQRMGKDQPPNCMRDERPLLVNRQVALVDPSDK